MSILNEENLNLDFKLNPKKVFKLILKERKRKNRYKLKK